MRYFLPIVISLLLVPPALAQSRYTTWSDPDSKNSTTEEGSSDRINKLIGELNALIDEASKARAANPVFLQDLKDLARKYQPKYSTPVRRQILGENFADGDFTRAPVWTVTSGQYRIEKGWGLRSVVTTDAAQQNSGQGNAEAEDPAAALLGALLKSALGGKKQAQGQASQSAPTSTAAIIHTMVKLGNAFDLTLQLSSWANTGKFSLGPYQGSRQQAGYRLVYSPGKRLELVRLSSRGAFAISRSARPISLEDKKTHSLHWTRDRQGRMQILLDSNLLIDTTDQSFRDAFQGLVISNKDTDVIVKKVVVEGGS